MNLESSFSDPVVAQEAYRAAGLLKEESLVEILSAAVALSPHSTALVGNKKSYTYQELWLEVLSLASGLQAHGLKSGDTAVLHMGNDESFVVVFLALLSCGVAPVLALPAHRLVELRHFAATSGARWMILSSHIDSYDATEMIGSLKREFASQASFLVKGSHADALSLDQLPKRNALPEKPATVAIAFFLLSGGTTGLPKLIPRRHAEYAYNIRVSAVNAGMNAATRYLAVLPMAHNFTLGCPGLLGCLVQGGTVVIVQNADPGTCFSYIQRHRITHTALVPSLALVWVDALTSFARADLSSLKRVQVGGAKVTPSLAGKLMRAFPGALQQSYGMGEGMLSQTRLDATDWQLLNTQGKPLSEMDEIRIVNEEGCIVEIRPARGELQVRGPYTIRSYFNAGPNGLKTFTPDGFFCTGDLVRVEVDGSLIVEGRINDVINRGGDKIGPDELENLLLLHEAVQDVAVLAIPDSSLGHRTCAAIVANRRLRLPEIRDFLRSLGLAEYKLPDKLLQVNALPKTALGKVDRRSIQRDLQDHRSNLSHNGTHG